VNPYLANAGRTDVSGAEVNLTVICIGIVAVVAVIALLPMIFAWQRRGRFADAITTYAPVWGIAMAGVLVNTSLAWNRWLGEAHMRLMSGYAESTDTTGAPVPPLKLIGGLVAVWVAMLAASQLRGAPRPAPAKVDNPVKPEAAPPAS